MSLYSSDDGEDPNLFTVAGVLVVLILGAIVFGLLYSVLDTPSSNPVSSLLGTATPTVALGPPASATASGVAVPLTPVASVTAVAASTPTPSAAPTVLATLTTLPTATGAPTMQGPGTATPAPPTIQPSPTPRRARFRVVIGRNVPLNIRQTPRLDGTVRQQLRNGDVVEDVGVPTRRADLVVWRKVRSMQGREGWVSDAYLRPID